MNGPDYRTAAEYWRDKAWAERRARLDGVEMPETPDDECPSDTEQDGENGETQ